MVQKKPPSRAAKTSARQRDAQPAAGAPIQAAPFLTEGLGTLSDNFTVANADVKPVNPTPAATISPQLVRHDIANEGWREYVYADGGRLRIEGAHTLIVEAKPGENERHLLITREGDEDIASVVQAPWRVIRWPMPAGTVVAA